MRIREAQEPGVPERGEIPRATEIRLQAAGQDTQVRRVRAEAVIQGAPHPVGDAGRENMEAVPDRIS